MYKLNKLAGLLLIAVFLAMLLASCGEEAASPTPLPSVAGNVVPFTASPTAIPATTTAGTTAAPTVPGTAPVTNTPVPATTAPPATTASSATTLVRYQPVFAAYKEPAVSKSTPVFPKYTVAPDLANITNLKDFNLSDAQKKLLAQNYFVVSPSDYKQFFQAYESFRYDQIPTYVSTDSVVHIYHLLFDKLLRETEKGYLISDLQSLNRALYGAAYEEYSSLNGTDLEPAATRTLAYVAVASRLSNPQITLNNMPAAVSNLVTAELKLIDGAAGIAGSPLMGSDYEEDYSQYKPRGHYTQSEELKNYFRAMMWYGRLTFRAKTASETQSALLLTQALLKGQDGTRKAGDIWQLIYEPTAFFVGTSDDLTYRDYAGLIKNTWGSETPTDLKVFADKTRLEAFQKSIDTLPPPKVNSMITYIFEDQETQIKGLRMMGQRFTLDAYIFQNLIWRRVGTLEKPRDLPKALDVFAAFGSDQAAKLLDQQGETSYQNYTSQLEKVEKDIAKIPGESWTQNLYWSWLNLLRSYAEKRGSGYPAYMQNEAWQNKQLVAGLGSLTELKHDTLLYAKQVYAERGGGPVELPTGFVEPEPLFFARVAALAAMTRDGLQQRHLIDTQYVQVLDNLEKYALQFKSIAEKELAGQKISDADREFIAYWGANIEYLTTQAADAETGTGRKYIDKQDAAVVADIATGLTQVLEEGTGRINLIYVAVLINGKVTLTQGAVYSQYEFTVNPAERMTDETWQQRLDSGKAPPLESWKLSYMAAPPAKQP
ncbi:MAG TPA: DUF3160 domain-containing protein [Chloroflexia bacterium]|nr:DUF3160 domain-containing protein [Chloroflexia bacterium]